MPGTPRPLPSEELNFLKKPPITLAASLPPAPSLPSPFLPEREVLRGTRECGVYCTRAAGRLGASEAAEFLPGRSHPWLGGTPISWRSRPLQVAKVGEGASARATVSRCGGWGVEGVASLKVRRACTELGGGGGRRGWKPGPDRRGRKLWKRARASHSQAGSRGRPGRGGVFGELAG